MSTQIIDWSNSVWYDWGYYPSVGLSGSNVVEVHQDGNISTNNLWYHLGTAL
jgi:hypothetical protein